MRLPPFVKALYDPSAHPVDRRRLALKNAMAAYATLLDPMVDGRSIDRIKFFTVEFSEEGVKIQPILDDEVKV